jgi:ABC-type glycerol-3-phosphate transport system permease component
MFTLPLSVEVLNRPYEVYPGTVLARATVSTVPIVIAELPLQRHFMPGCMSGAIKR